MANVGMLLIVLGTLAAGCGIYLLILSSAGMHF